MSLLAEYCKTKGISYKGNSFVRPGETLVVVKYEYKNWVMPLRTKKARTQGSSYGGNVGIHNYVTSTVNSNQFLTELICAFNNKGAKIIKTETKVGSAGVVLVKASARPVRRVKTVKAVKNVKSG